MSFFKHTCSIAQRPAKLPEDVLLLASNIISHPLLPCRNDTAILIFSRSAALESVAKPLTVNARGVNKAIASCLIRHTRQIARASRLPVFFVSEHQQRGENFGERFAHAFEQLFARGYERVISIGNDCLHLQATDLNAAAEHLDNHAFVFGPALDGGAYLVAMRREAYQRQRFSCVPWQTSGVLDGLKSHAEGDFYLLDVKADVDSARDLQGQLRHDRSKATVVKIRLLRLLKSPIAAFDESPPSAWAVFLLPILTLRGPPAQLAR